MKEYYKIPISKTIVIIWLIVTGLLTILTLGQLFLLLIIPAIYYFIVKACNYSYDDERIIVETGIINKKQKIVPLYRLTNISAQDNIFNYGIIYIRDKEQTVVLKYVQNSKAEMLKLNEKWEHAKNQNIRNEVF